MWPSDILYGISLFQRSARSRGSAFKSVCILAWKNHNCDALSTAVPANAVFYCNVSTNVSSLSDLDDQPVPAPIEHDSTKTQNPSYLKRSASGFPISYLFIIISLAACLIVILILWYNLRTKVIAEGIRKVNKRRNRKLNGSDMKGFVYC